MEDQPKPTQDLEGDEQDTHAPVASSRDTRDAIGSSRRQRISEERIAILTQALGDPQHPLHLEAEEELVEIAAPAVPTLINALHPDRPWLMSYRAAEALGQIGDGRASGPLIQALNHPNSNVRWSAVRALAQVGDTRAILPLRRVARYDRGKTSWGESVAAAAHSALEQMQARSTLWRLGDPAKTAILFALTLAAVIIAVTKVGELRAELQGATQIALLVTPVMPTPTPPEEGEEAEAGSVAITETSEPLPTPQTTPTTAAQANITAKVKENANVRNGPGPDNRVVAQVLADQSVTILGSRGDWWLITFDEGKSQGWIYKELLEEPSAPVPTLTPAQG